MGVVTPWHENAFRRLGQIINEPEKFVAPDAALQSDLRVLLKVIYDEADGLDQYGPLPELIVDGLDPEQIWEEIELRTEPLVDRVQQCVADYQATAERSQMERRSPDDDDAAADHSDDDDDIAEDVSSDEHSEAVDEMDDSEHDHDDEQQLAMEEEDDDDRRQPASDEVADDFFNIDDMEAFADQMEMNDDGEHSGSDDDEEEEPVDLLHDIGGGVSAQYGDMFEESTTPSAIIDDDEFAGLSEFKKRQLRLQKEIEQIEERNLTGRPWQLMGEAKAADRPADALIDADLDFEMADKRPTLITADVTQDVEELIRQRIKDRAYDDVERKAEPAAAPFRARSELETDKSEVGLADLYEKEYVAKAGGASEADEQLSKEHKEIASMFAALCYKLDALANFHFTPKATRDEVVVRTNVAAIAMEEAIPVAVSAAQALAPEEVYRPAKHEPVADTELSRDEKKARRRAKKDRTRKERQQKTAEDDVRAKHDARFKAKRDTKLALEEIGASKMIKTAAASKQDAAEFTRSGTFFKNIQDAEARRGQPTTPVADTAIATKSSTSFKL